MSAHDISSHGEREENIMHVFVTGASGWIGSHTVDELLANGHEVTGLVRSDASEAALRAKGAEPLRGDLDDLDSLRRGAERADAVVHLANKHDYSDTAENDRAERAAASTLLEVLGGTDRPFAIASGVALVSPGRIATEDIRLQFRGADAPRGGSENLAFDAVERGVRSLALRFAPTVHGIGDHGFVAAITADARRAGVARYPGDGENRWPAVHVRDAAAMIRLGLEHAPAGTALHAVAEEGVRSRDIAAAIGARLGLPVESEPTEATAERLPFIGRFFGMDIPASAAATRELLGWTPTGPTLLEDIAAGAYDHAATVAG